MTKKPKISSQPSPILATTKIESDSQLLISYKYLCLDNKKYSMDEISDNKIKIQFYREFNKKIKEYCQMNNFRKEINENGRYRDTNHIHSIDWNDSKIREECFTSLSSKLMEQIKGECWQLGINSTTFRVHGFFIENVFYVVWLDPMHNLYKQK